MTVFLSSVCNNMLFSDVNVLNFLWYLISLAQVTLNKESRFTLLLFNEGDLYVRVMCTLEMFMFSLSCERSWNGDMRASLLCFKRCDWDEAADHLSLFSRETQLSFKVQELGLCHKWNPADSTCYVQIYEWDLTEEWLLYVEMKCLSMWLMWHLWSSQWCKVLPL